MANNCWSSFQSATKLGFLGVLVHTKYLRITFSFKKLDCCEQPARSQEGGVFCIVLTLTPVTLTHWREVMCPRHWPTDISKQSSPVTSFEAEERAVQYLKHSTTTNYAIFKWQCVALHLAKQILGHKSARHGGTPSAHLCVLAITCLQPCVSWCVWGNTQYLAVFII